jgi:hypothetical protein
MFSGLLTLTTYTHGLMLVMLQSESYAYLYICINLMPQLKMGKKVGLIIKDVRGWHRWSLGCEWHQKLDNQEYFLEFKVQ